MTEQSILELSLLEKEIVDTVLNVIVFVFIGVLIWLYTRAPTHLDD